MTKAIDKFLGTGPKLAPVNPAAPKPAKAKVVKKKGMKEVKKAAEEKPDDPVETVDE